MMVSFTHPFRLPGSDEQHAAGSYEVREDREPLDVSWPAYRVSMTMMISNGATTEAWPISGADLERLLAQDQRERFDVA
jgi:hypothetical protein